MNGAKRVATLKVADPAATGWSLLVEAVQVRSVPVDARTRVVMPRPVGGRRVNVTSATPRPAATRMPRAESNVCVPDGSLTP